MTGLSGAAARHLIRRRVRTAACAVSLSIAIMVCGAAARAETLLERGTYLMQGIAACGNCHTPQGPEGPLPGMELAGGLVMDFGEFVAHTPNLTPDVETGLGAWSDQEIIAAIREGRRPDGSIIGPPMPIGLYRGISDRDAAAIVAYLRALKPVKNAVPASVYSFPLPQAYGPPVTTVAEVSPGDKLAYGAYLAGPLGHCIECHSPMGPKGPDWEHRRGAGGLYIPGPWGVSVSTNITPVGLHGWSDAEIKAAITRGLRPDGSRLAPPMPVTYYSAVKDADLDAIVSYLRSLPEK